MNFLVFFAILSPPSSANWLHECSECVDQSLFSDVSLKTDISSANISALYEEISHWQLRTFEHTEKEFVNRFFSRSNQLGVIAQELASVSPNGVVLIPERRATSSNGTIVSTRNVLLVRETYILFALVGGFQFLTRKYEKLGSDYWTRVGNWEKTLVEVSASMSEMQGDQKDLKQGISGLDKEFFVLKEGVVRAENGLAHVGSELSNLGGKIGGILVIVSDVEKRLENEKMQISNFQVLEMNRKLEFEVFRREISQRVEVLESNVQHIQQNEFRLRSVLKRLIWLETNWLISGRVQAEKVARFESLLARNLTQEMAKQREEFETNLFTKREETDLRLLREKIRAESVIAEKNLAVEREKLKVDLAVRYESVKLESEMKFRDRRENEDINIRELAIVNEAEREKVLAVIRETAKLVQDWATLENVFFVIGAILVLFIGFFIARESAVLVREQIGKYWGRPSLVRYTSVGKGWWFCPHRHTATVEDKFSDVVLDPSLFAQIKRLAVATKTAKLRKSPLLHCMYYGPPGTGKTMVAKRFAEYSNLDYAIMCGGDVAPLGADGVTEIHNLFKWVHKSSKGVLLFIDEAESFLCARTVGMSENLRNAVTAMLYHTGTASSQFMLIIATNRPGDIDPAIIDRMDESIEFGLPDFIEREKLVCMYFLQYTHSADTADEMTEQLSQIAKTLTGFSGREISKLFMSVQTHMYSLGMKNCTVEVLKSVADQKIIEHAKNRAMMKAGYVFDESKLGQWH